VLLFKHDKSIQIDGTGDQHKIVKYSINLVKPYIVYR
jgi:hypothetical protein